MLKWKQEKQKETVVYGILSLVFAMAFFFGTLYPSYGLSKDACVVTEEKEIDTLEIHYRFYFFDRLMNKEGSIL